jgi:hypothetical protein
VGQIIAIEPTVGNHRDESSVGNQSDDQAKRTRNKEASLASGNRRLAKADAHRRITQNHRQREHGHDPVDLCNIIDDRRCHSARIPSPQRCSPT